VDALEAAGRAVDQRERLAGKRVGVLLTGGNVDLDAIAQSFASAANRGSAG
jgi:threonine dehydratase